MKPTLRCACVFLMLALPVQAQSPSDPAVAAEARETSGPNALSEELLDLSLEQLLSVEVVSVSRKKQELAQTPAAVFVITSEDIRRSGATTIPDLLRMVPGLHVGQINSSVHAVAARGFNGRFANDLLVLIDGRSIYTPIFSGVYWDTVQLPLEEIERIEVVRGPGGTLWGANAVNGVINIITKHSSESQGWRVTGSAGTEERAHGEVRYGGQIDEDATYRAYLTYRSRDDMELRDGNDGTGEDWESLQGGFRLDMKLSEIDTLRITGDAHYNARNDFIAELSPLPPFETEQRGTSRARVANLVLRYDRELSETSDVTVQSYYDSFERTDNGLDLSVQTFDIEVQHRFRPLDSHEIVWGAGYRIYRDDYGSSFETTFAPDHDTYDLLSAFIQDEIQLTETLRLTVGSKFEHNDYTGFEYQPSARMLWEASEEHTFWGAVTRAVRTPSRSEESLNYRFYLPGTPPVFGVLSGGNDLDAEDLLAFEVGYRTTPIDNVALDVTAFYNEYDGLITSVTGTPEFVPVPFPRIDVPLSFENGQSADTYGLEAVVDYRPTSWWSLDLAYSYLRMDLDAPGTSEFATADEVYPEHTTSLRSRMNLLDDIELDAWLRYTSRLTGFDIDSYLTLDLRVGWKLDDDLELFLVGRNLLQNSHMEYEDEFLHSPPSEVERSVYAGFDLRF